MHRGRPQVGGLPPVAGSPWLPSSPFTVSVVTRPDPATPARPVSDRPVPSRVAWTIHPPLSASFLREMSERPGAPPRDARPFTGLHSGNRKQDVSGSISDRRCRDRWRPAANRLTTAARGCQALASIMRDPRWTHPDRRMQHQPARAQVCVAREVFHSVAMAWASSARLLTGAECPQARVLEQSTSVASSNRSFVILLAWQRMRARQGDHDIHASAGRSVRGFES